MPIKIEITNVTRSVNLYGRSKYPRKIRGTYSCTIQGNCFTGLEIAEGHVNSQLGWIRVLSILNSMDHWEFDHAVERLIDSELNLTQENESVSFKLERISVHVRAKGIFPDNEKKIRGPGTLILKDRVPIEIFEPDQLGKRDFYILCPHDVQKRLFQQIDSHSVCELLMDDQNDS